MPLGWECVAVCEIDKSASAVLSTRFPNVPNLGDFTKIGVEDVGTIDLLVGGTPCQDFSVAGLRAGMDGDRGQLTIEFARLAERLRPRWLVWENVPGILSVDNGRAFGTFLRILGKFGYGFAYRILDAQYCGVPQRRRRVFVVGHLGDWQPAAAVLFERHSLSGYPPPRREAGKGVAGCLKGGSGERGWPDPSDGNGGGLVDVAGTLAGGSGERGWQHHDGAGAFIPEWPAEIASTLDSHFGDKQGLEDQHINSGASHFVPADKPIYATDGQGNAAFAEDQALALNATHEQPYVVGTMACNTGPKGHDAGNFQSNQGVDSGYVIPVEQPMCIKGAAIGRKPEAGPQYGEVLTDGSSYTLNASETHGVLAFAQNTREEVRIIGEDGDVSGSLSAETGTHQSTYLAFTGTARQGWAPPSCPISIDCALPLDTKREQAIVMLNLQGSKGNSVAQEDGPSFTLNSMHGHDVHAIAYKPVGFIHPRQLRGIETSNQVGIKTEADISDALTGEGPGAVSFHTSGYGGQVDENVSQTLQASDARLSNQVAGVIQQMQVRRLTPIECERLQGIPDNWTKITEKSADGPRYRMIGNSFAVPVVAWIGKRIQMVEELIESI